MLKKSHYHYLGAFSVGILFVYILIRASSVSFTHDESLTFTIISDQSLWKDTINNHLLNTLFSGFLFNWFGNSELVLRMPNILSFAIYAIGGLLILRKAPSAPLYLLGFSAIFFNHFLIEFFSLARGYGLATSFIMLSFYFLLRRGPDYPFKKILTDWIAITILGTLAIYSSLAMTNVYIAIVLLLLYKTFRWHISNSDQQRLKIWLSVVILSAIPLLLAITRLLTLLDNNQLSYGADSIVWTFISLIKSYVYLSPATPLLRLSLGIFLILALFLSVFFVLRVKNWDSPLLYMLAMFAMLVMGSTLEHYLFDVKFPVKRTAIYFLPIIGLLIYFAAVSFHRQYECHRNIGNMAIALVTMAVFLNFVYPMNITQAKYCPYDSQTKKMMAIVEQNLPSKKAYATISHEWKFQPTINFYIDKFELPIRKSNRSGVNTTSDFIYTIDMNSKPSGYTLLKAFGDVPSHLWIRNEHTSPTRQM